MPPLRRCLRRLLSSLPPAEIWLPARALTGTSGTGCLGGIAAAAAAARSSSSAAAAPPTVFVVESPAKARKIQEYLGDAYHVLATYGHVRDLPEKPGSVAPDADFALRWVFSPGGKGHVAEIAQAVRAASGRVVLATDPDREGEAISWHLVQALQGHGVLDPGAPPQRVTFTEVTPAAVAAALAAPRPLDGPLVDAYLGRRALDYLFGFHLSPLLWRKLPGARSAGRVQSAALRLVTEREAAIEAFCSAQYWTVGAHVELPDGRGTVAATLASLDGAPPPKPGFHDAEAAEAVASRLAAAELLVRSASVKEASRTPPPPFTTSTLQQEANKRLGLGAARTMAVAQALYEGGHITYMRTDGVAVSPAAAEALRSAVEASHGVDYLPPQPRKYTAKSKNAQEAHEAIRPTNPRAAPGAVAAAGAEPQAVQLYALIRARALASQMASARLQQAVAEFATPDGALVLRASASAVTFPGYLAAHGATLPEDPAEDAQSSTDNARLATMAAAKAVAVLPSLRLGEHAVVGAAAAAAHHTRALPRFTEGTLVKALEEAGVGRPSTYAPTLRALQFRGYVRREGRTLRAEPLGRALSAFLAAYFEPYVDFAFTSKMESRLDEVSAGVVEWKELVGGFWGPFSERVAAAEAVPGAEVIDMLNKELAKMLFGAEAASTSGGKEAATSTNNEGGAVDAAAGETRACPLCGSPLSVKLSSKKGSSGPFVGCSAHPVCTYTRSIVQEAPAAADTATAVTRGAGRPGLKPLADAEAKYGMRGAVYVLGTDPRSGKDVYMRTGPFGPYVQLSVDSDPQMRRIPLPKRTLAAQMDLEYALSVLSLPRMVGPHPETGLLVEVRNGKFGPFVQHQGTKRSIPKDIDPLEISLSDALALLDKAKLSQGLMSKAKLKEAAGAGKQANLDRPRKGDPKAEGAAPAAAGAEERWRAGRTGAAAPLGGVPGRGAAAADERPRDPGAQSAGVNPIVSLFQDMDAQLPRPRTPFVIFMQEQTGSTVVHQGPAQGDTSAEGTSTSEGKGGFMQDVASRWRKLSESMRQVYYDAAEAERENYVKQKLLLARGLALVAAQGAPAAGEPGAVPDVAGREF